ncbi:MAG: non-oxidative hydroxyarylic acid decarboxylases subunit D [Edaphobacter sp.]|uniref:non-oxidative hydroxyarylic acid decarboxylases subunit D n=1 Tax=Edaphobacter sp. TaxID=1934404 RepID=UPI0023A38927|nr:non-oxidative hydroxyarylic acid decarboxylases subunit D [Edaphobacter sp.]MDE1175925.1 non-oxidative hydroxyarylic acid decarboxylases subunit D [Edaphobacter sp.]
MSTTTTPAATVPVCPRCRSNTTEVRSVSPVAGVWTVFGCDTCFYTWRSTEGEQNTNPDKYPEVFRLEPQNLPKLQVAPSIPPLRQTKP